MEHILYWIWLTLKLKSAKGKINALLEWFGSVENIYLAKNYDHMAVISDNEKTLLLDKDLSKAKAAAEKIAAIDGKIIVYDDKNYPQLLKNIHNPPYVLYIQGKVPEMDKVLTIGVVGTRYTTEYGRVVTKRLCSQLAENGVVTVSGLAVGIDAVGAWASLEKGGMTVGVIGSGLDIVYPSDNSELYKAIAKDGCIMTEFPPGTPPFKTNFPMRNRIIAGLSRGVLVTEAPRKSGSLITAKYALENNRDVFAVPRNITEEKYIGTNILIRQGAKLVNCAGDIMSEYPYAKKITPEEIKAEKAVRKADNTERYKNLNESEKQITDLLIKNDMQVDEISRELNVPVGDVNMRLMMLEVKGLVKKLPGNRYQLRI